MARPRDPSVEPRILTAARELLSEGGYAALTMEAVAARAGVGKPTVYRRWPSRVQLVFDLFAGPFAPDVVPDRGTLRDDLVDLGDHLVVSLTAIDRSITGDQLGEMIDDEEFSERVRTERIAPDLDALEPVWGRAVARGEIADAETGRELLGDLTGVVVYRVLMLHETLDRSALERLVDRLLLGVLAA